MKADKAVSADTACTLKDCFPAYGVMAVSGIVGGASLALFAIFLYAGLPGGVGLGLNDPAGLFLDSLLCLLFFLQHSLMLRNPFRKWLSGVIPSDYLSAFYAIFSGVFLIILMLFWQKSTYFRIELEGPMFLMMRILFVTAVIGFFVAVRSLRFFDPLGIKEIFCRTKGKTTTQSTLTVQGAYRWVRHPLYLLSLLMIWSMVTITPDRLLFNGLWSFWVIAGAFLEERDLIASFGDAYRHYQRNVPMLIPFRLFPRNIPHL